jgi:hypothetical protein
LKKNADLDPVLNPVTGNTLKNQKISSTDEMLINLFFNQSHTGSFLVFLCLIIYLFATVFPSFWLFLGLLDPEPGSQNIIDR